MSDTGAPYDKAIEESAKTASKAIDLVRDGATALSRPISNIFGLIIGDHIEAARQRNLDAIVRKTRKILAERDLAETAPIAEQIAFPLLEAAQGEPRPEMQELWSILLANAMDPSRRDEVRQEFIGVLKTFHPTDALVLNNINKQQGYVQPHSLGAGVLREATVVVSLRNLNLSSCVEESQGAYKITPFGSELVRACSP